MPCDLSASSTLKSALTLSSGVRVLVVSYSVPLGTTSMTNSEFLSLQFLHKLFF